jgi:DNA modification methylase
VPSPTKPPSLQVESWPIERLIPYARNARTHSDAQVAQIAASITEFGFNNPILVDGDGGIIAGHGRVLAARKLGRDEVPVIVLRHLTPNQKRAFMLADNKLALNAGWDEDLLRLELEALAEQQFPLGLTGFDDEDLKQLLAAENLNGHVDADDAPPAEVRAVTLPGDVWELGRHRILCADASAPANLQRVLAGNSCDLVFTDIPYNVDYCGKGRDKMKIVNDNLGAEFTKFLAAACGSILSVSAGSIYICMSSSELHHLYAAFVEAGGHWSTYIIWAKSLFTLGRSDFQRQYEAILYGWREGGKHFWCGARDQGDVWLVDKPRANDLHPTMKPVELVERAITSSSRKSDIVLDPFAGSGTTAIACERTGRQARLIDLDPRYVDVTVRRWQAYTGETARLEREGCSFEEAASQRLRTPGVVQEGHL